MNPLVLAALFLGLSTLVTLIWLVVRAFKKHAVWGLAVLLLSPIGAALFGVRYWNDEKKPFLAYSTSMVAALSLGIYLFATQGGMELVRTAYNVQNGTLPHAANEEDTSNFLHTNLTFYENPDLRAGDQPEPGPELDETNVETNDSGSLETQDSTSTSEEAEEAVARPVRYRLAYVPIRMDKIGDYVGSVVKVTRKNVPEKEYRLTGASGSKLQLVQRTSGGSFSFKYRKRDIEKIRVLVNKPY
jgi:hypothetical protein